MITVDFSYEQLLQKLRDRERFDFARFGDGEWAAMLQSRKKGAVNTDGHHFFPDLGEALQHVLKDSPDYYIGLQRLAVRQHPEAIKMFTRKYDLKWCPSDFLHTANMEDGMKDFFDVLKTRNVLLVGPRRLYPVAVEHGWYFARVPSKDCWLAREEIEADLDVLIGLWDEPVILYCASMMSEVLIHKYRGRATQIDTGSVFDLHVGVGSRSYMRKMLE